MKKEKITVGCVLSLFLWVLFAALASAGFAEGTSGVLRLIAIIPLVFGFLCLGQLLGGGGGSGGGDGSSGCGGGCGGCGGGE